MATANIINAIADGLVVRCQAITGVGAGYVNTAALVERVAGVSWPNKTRPFIAVSFGGMRSNVAHPNNYYRAQGAFYADFVMDAATGTDLVDCERAALSMAEDIARAVGLDYQLAGALVAGQMLLENIEVNVGESAEAGLVAAGRVTFVALWEWSA